MRSPKKKRKKKKLRTKRGSVAKMERTPVLSTGFKAHCNEDKEKEEKQAGRGAKRATTNEESAANANNNNTAAPIPAPRMEFRKRRSFEVGKGTCITLANIKYDVFAYVIIGVK